MKKILIATLVGAACASTATFAEGSSDKTGWYGGLKGGVSLMHSGDFIHRDNAGTFMEGAGPAEKMLEKGFNKSTGAFGAKLGYDFYPQQGAPVRTELDYTYRGQVKSGAAKVRMQTVMMNAGYDFRNDSRFTPYVTAGVGYAHVKVTNPVWVVEKEDASGRTDKGGINRIDLEYGRGLDDATDRKEHPSKEGRVNQLAWKGVGIDWAPGDTKEVPDRDDKEGGINRIDLEYGRGLDDATDRKEHPSKEGWVNQSVNSSNLAWGVGAGVRYAASDNVDIDLGYKYVDAGNAKVAGSNKKVRVNTNDFMLGINYNF